MKIGLFFGSFNPIHVGHMIIANLVKETSEINEVWFIVTPQNPHKTNKNLLHEFDRYDLVKAAINEDYGLRVMDIEFQLPKPSFTIDTLVYIKEQYPDHDFLLIIGEDNLASFPKWKNHELIIENFGLIVYPRPDSNPSELKQDPRVNFIEAPKIDISASLIRKLVKTRKSIKYLVPEVVENMIRDKGYYL